MWQELHAGTDRATRKSLGYDKPVIVQWTDFLGGVVTGRDYPDDPALRAAAPAAGHALRGTVLRLLPVVNTKTVNELMKEAFPVSLSIALAALVMWLFFGISRGDSRGNEGHDHRPGDRRRSPWSSTPSRRSSSVSSCSSSSPSSGSWSTSGLLPIAEGGVGGVADLPVPARHHPGLLYMAGYVRMTRAFVLESMSEDYVRTARAKG